MLLNIPECTGQPQKAKKAAGQNERKWQPTPAFLPGNPMDGGTWWQSLAAKRQLHTRRRSRSVVFDFVQPDGLQPTRLLPPRNFPGKSTGVGCRFLLQYIHTVPINKQYIDFFLKDGKKLLWGNASLVSPTLHNSNDRSSCVLCPSRPQTQGEATRCLHQMPRQGPGATAPSPPSYGGQRTTSG